MKHKELTGKIIECAYKAHNNLGLGFLESVYQNALLIELGKAGLKAEKEKRIQVGSKPLNWDLTPSCPSKMLMVEIGKTLAGICLKNRGLIFTGILDSLTY